MKIYEANARPYYKIRTTLTTSYSWYSILRSLHFEKLPNSSHIQFHPGIDYQLLPYTQFFPWSWQSSYVDHNLSRDFPFPALFTERLGLSDTKISICATTTLWNVADHDWGQKSKCLSGFFGQSSDLVEIKRRYREGVQC